MSDVLETKYKAALVRGAEHMIAHGLLDWRVKLHNKRKVLADCNNRTRTIRYSKHFLKIATPDQLDGVTLHEIAHALVGPGHGHDAVFKRKVREISPTTKYVGANVEEPIMTHRYNLECPECGSTSRTNVNKRYICGDCNKKGNRVPFIVKENILQVVGW